MSKTFICYSEFHTCYKAIIRHQELSDDCFVRSMKLRVANQPPERRNTWCYTVILKKRGSDSLLASMYSSGKTIEHFLADDQFKHLTRHYILYIFIHTMKNWKSNDVVTSQYEILTDPF